VRSATVAALDYPKRTFDCRHQDLGSGPGKHRPPSAPWAQQGMTLNACQERRGHGTRQRVYFLRGYIGGNIIRRAIGGPRHCWVVFGFQAILTLVEGKAQPAESQRTNNAPWPN